MSGCVPSYHDQVSESRSIGSPPFPVLSRTAEHRDAVNSNLLSALSRNLDNFVDLNAGDLDAVESLSRNSKLVRADQILVHERGRCDHLCVILEGLACRYKILPNGRRQVLGYLIPGDLCDINFLLSDIPDHGVVAVGDSRVADVPIQRISELLRTHPNVARAVALASLRDSVILREWLLNVGQRDALQRLSHFFCEMAVRMGAVGQLRSDGSIELPVNQVTLADTIGLTPVHINRTLQRLRIAALINFRSRRLHILDFGRLTELAGFDGHYLGLKAAIPWT